MDSQLMKHAQQSSARPHAQWRLGASEALRLHVGPGPREFHVTEGRVWLTREGTDESPSEDLWLNAGDDVALASGSVWVAEAWSKASFQLLVPPQACTRGQHGLLRRLSASVGQRASAWLAQPSRRPAGWA